MEKTEHDVMKQTLQRYMENPMKRNELNNIISKLPFDDFDAELNCMVAVLCLNASLYQEALLFCREAAKQDKQYMNSYIVLAEIMLSLGKYNEAIDACRAVYELGYTDIAKGQSDTVKSLCQKALAAVAPESESIIDYYSLQYQKVTATMTDEEIYEIAAQLYNQKKTVQAAAFLEILTVGKNVPKYSFLAGLNYFMSCLQVDFIEKIIFHLTAFDLTMCSLENRDCLKTAEMLRSVYWDIGDCKKAYEYAMLAFQRSDTPAKARFNLSTGLFIANRLPQLSGAELYALHCRYQSLLTDIKPYSKELYQHDKIRIGYISPDLRRHAVAYFVMPLFDNYSRSRFEVYCYARCNEDEISEKMKQNVNVWRNVKEHTDEMIAAVIKNDEIDILVELAGHTANNSLAVIAHRPAPIQLCGIGYVSTTGINEIDYFITDPYCTDEKQKNHFSEQPYILPKTHLCYAELNKMPEPCHSDPMGSRPIIFACFNRLSKISSELLLIWAEILRQVPNSRLRLKCMEFSCQYGKKYIVQRLIQAGFDINRVIIDAPSTDYLACYNEVDIALDTYPCGGGTTTLEALYMGVPVITLVGDSHVSRFGYSILKNIGLDELIATDEQSYIDKAVWLASRRDLLLDLHQQLRSRLRKSPLMDEIGYCDAVEEMYYNIYRKFVRSVEDEQASILLKQAQLYIDQNKIVEAYELVKNIPNRYSGLVEMMSIKALCLMKLERMEEAEQLYLHILEYDDNLQTYIALAMLYGESLQYVKMRDVLNKAKGKIKGRNIDSEKVYSMLGFVNTILANPDEAAAAYHQAALYAGDKKSLLAEFDNYLFSSNYSATITQEELYRRHLTYNKILADITPYEHKFRCNDKIKVGYLSADFNNHAVGNYVQAFLRFADKERFEVFCYYSNNGEDDMVTDLFRQEAMFWYDVGNKSDYELASLIKSHGIDILVDLGGHTARSRLAVMAYRPAPVQISGIGYFHSTGLREVDYFLGDNYCDCRELNEQYFSEKILKLSHTHWCYHPFRCMPDIEHDLPADKNGYITFVSFNNFSKVSDNVIGAWADILRQLSNARLMLKSRIFDSDEGKDYIIKRLERGGLAKKQLVLRGISNEYLMEYSEADIALDTFPYTGGVTTCEALYMGIPVITLAGRRHGSRFGVSILSNIGCEELIAQNEQEYIKKAVTLAGDRERLRMYRCNLRPLMLNSPLMDAVSYMKELESKYFKAFRDWQTGKIKAVAATILHFFAEGREKEAFELCTAVCKYILANTDIQKSDAKVRQ